MKNNTFRMRNEYTKNATETSEKMSGVSGQGVNTDR